MTQLDPLLPEAQIDPDSRPAVDWLSDPWDATDETGSVERLRTERRTLKWLVWTSMVLAVLAILVAGAVGWWYLGKINPEGAAGDVQSFTVNDTDTIESVSQRLADDGLISDPGVFEWYVEREGGLELTPGYYEIRPDDHMGNVLGRLRTPPGQTYTDVTFPEGFTLTRMSQRLAASVPRLTADGFMTSATDGTIRAAWQPPEINSLEGLLFPDTYNVSNAESEAQVIERMISLMERVGQQEDIVNRSAALGITPYQALIIASLIEREAKVPEDRAKISKVIHNRLADTAFGIPFRVADRRVGALRRRAGGPRPGTFVRRTASDRRALEHLHPPRSARHADRQARTSVDRSSPQPSARPTGRRPHLRRAAQSHRLPVSLLRDRRRRRPPRVRRRTVATRAQHRTRSRRRHPVSRRRLAALIGSPVEHSLSPVIHQAAFDAAGVDWTYVAFDVAEDRASDAIAAMRVLGLSGLSVTMPHKHDVASAVDRLDPAAAALASVNTVSWDGDELVGSSTDGAGFVNSLADDGIDVAGAQVAIIGAGGAARSVIDALGRAGAASIRVVNRTVERAESACRLALVAAVGDSSDIERADIVVNASSVGMGIDPTRATLADLPCDPALLGPQQVVVDLVYHPLTTAWLARAADNGVRTIDGLGMLIHQAALQQTAWLGITPDLTAMRRAAEEALAARAADAEHAAGLSNQAAATDR